MENKKLEIGEVVVVKHRKDAPFKVFKPVTYGRVESYNYDDNGEIYSYNIHGEDGYDYAVCYPIPYPLNAFCGRYLIVTGKEYVDDLREKIDINTKITNELIEENTAKTEARNNKMRQEMQQRNTALVEAAQSLIDYAESIDKEKKVK
jgi:hypothetical protein